MSVALNNNVSTTPSEVLSKAVNRAGKALGLTQDKTGIVIGRTRAALQRGVDPTSKSGQLATYLVRIYRSLYAQVGGTPQDIKHWMHTENRHVGGVPAQLIETPEGLIQTMHYLDAIRGRI